MSELRKPKKFTVERSRWLRGEGPMMSYLLRRGDQKMCCVGFYALACGVGEVDIEGMRGFDELQGVDQWLFMGPVVKPDESDNGAAELVYRPNDAKYGLNEEEREAKIKEGFATIGVEVEFVD